MQLTENQVRIPPAEPRTRTPTPTPLANVISPPKTPAASSDDNNDEDFYDDFDEDEVEFVVENMEALKSPKLQDFFEFEDDFEDSLGQENIKDLGSPTPK